MRRDETKRERSARLCREGRAFESLVEHPGWKLLVEWAHGEDDAASRKVLRMDPRDSVAVAKTQGEARGRQSLLAHVQDVIKRYHNLPAEDGQDKEG